MLQDLASGAVIGLAYAAMAVGLSLIFGVLRIVNFAHGEFYMLGGLLLYSFTATGLGYFAALTMAVLVTMLVAAITERLVLAPLRRTDEETIAIVTLGLSIFFANTALVLWGPVPHLIESPFPVAALELPGEVRLSPMEVFACALTLTTMAILHWVLKYTTAGRQLRAVVQDRDAASLVGLNVEGIYLTTFSVGCGLAALAGGLLGTIFLTYPAMGLQAVMKAFAVVVIGGMGSLAGVATAGFLLGIAEALGGAWLPSGYKDIVAFILIVLTLSLRPQGLFGSKEIRVR